MKLQIINDTNTVFDLERAEVFESKELNSVQRMLCIPDENNDRIWIWNLNTTYAKLTKESAAIWFLNQGYVTQYSNDMFASIPYDLQKFASKCFLRGEIDEDSGWY